jgi:phosphoribosyl-AMP cyclohydrolase
MSDQLQEVKKVHDTYPDEPDDMSTGSPAQGEGVAVLGSVNRARRRPSRVPRPDSMSYSTYKAKQEFALKIGVHGLQEEMAKSTGVGKIDVLKGKLMVHFRSQSKLSQQELSDLQKATHFDKKELQQWYKGEFAAEVAHVALLERVLTKCQAS